MRIFLIGKMDCCAGKILTIEYKIPKMNKYFIFYYFCHCRVTGLVWFTSDNSEELTINFESLNSIHICLAEHNSFKAILQSSWKFHLYSRHGTLNAEIKLYASYILLENCRTNYFGWENVGMRFDGTETSASTEVDCSRWLGQYKHSWEIFYILMLMKKSLAKIKMNPMPVWIFRLRLMVAVLITSDQHRLKNKIPPLFSVLQKCFCGQVEACSCMYKWISLNSDEDKYFYYLQEQFLS